LGRIQHPGIHQPSYRNPVLKNKIQVLTSKQNPNEIKKRYCPKLQYHTFTNSLLPLCSWKQLGSRSYQDKWMHSEKYADFLSITQQMVLSMGTSLTHITHCVPICVVSQLNPSCITPLAMISSLHIN
jgi:hypothetical protein